jgi:hypothetical protein
MVVLLVSVDSGVAEAGLGERVSPRAASAVGFTVFWIGLVFFGGFSSFIIHLLPKTGMQFQGFGSSALPRRSHQTGGMAW